MKTIGYVRTGYARRDIDDVLRDVVTYSGWETDQNSFVKTTAIGMHGIFIDEAPYEYSMDNAEYLRTISRAAKDAIGILEPKTVSFPYYCLSQLSCLSHWWRSWSVDDHRAANGSTQVIRNPGTIPDDRLSDRNTDITVLFEQSFDLYQQRKSRLSALPGERSSKAYIIHSVPSNVHLRRFVDELAPHAEHLFLTDLVSHYYESFGGDWKGFVRGMAP